MHGNAPQDGGAPHGDEPGGAEPTAADRRALRRELRGVTADARALLPDSYAVGSEVVRDDGGLRGTVAVQPPAGAVVSGGFAAGEAGELARELAAGAVLEAKRAGEVSQTAR